MAKAWTRAKIEELAPIANARVVIATNVNPGDLASMRKAKRISLMGNGLSGEILLGTHGRHRIDAGGAATGQITGGEGDDGQNDGHGDESGRVVRGHAMEETGQ